MAAAVGRLGSEDWETLRSVRLEALRESPESFGRSHAEEADLDESYWRGLFSPSTAWFQAEIGGDSVGLAVGIAARPDDVDPEAAHLGSMWVAPSVRGSGVADFLVNAVVAWTKETGHPRLVLWVFDDTPRAAAFYRRAGFTETGQMRTFESPTPRTLRLLCLTIRP